VFYPLSVVLLLTHTVHLLCVDCTTPQHNSKKSTWSRSVCICVSHFDCLVMKFCWLNNITLVFLQHKDTLNSICTACTSHDCGCSGQLSARPVSAYFVLCLHTLSVYAHMLCEALQVAICCWHIAQCSDCSHGLAQLKIAMDGLLKHSSAHMNSCTHVFRHMLFPILSWYEGASAGHCICAAVGFTSACRCHALC
jgi:hypothetical protein